MHPFIGHPSEKNRLLPAGARPPNTKAPQARGESTIAQSEATTSHGVASERSETRSREWRNSGYMTKN